MRPPPKKLDPEAKRMARAMAACSVAVLLALEVRERECDFPADLLEQGNKLGCVFCLAGTPPNKQMLVFPVFFLPLKKGHPQKIQVAGPLELPKLMGSPLLGGEQTRMDRI